METSILIHDEQVSTICQKISPPFTSLICNVVSKGRRGRGEGGEREGRGRGEGGEREGRGRGEGEGGQGTKGERWKKSKIKKRDIPEPQLAKRREVVKWMNHYH